MPSEGSSGKIQAASGKVLGILGKVSLNWLPGRLFAAKGPAAKFFTGRTRILKKSVMAFIALMAFCFKICSEVL